MESAKRVIFVVGTTASGKSEWAMNWAQSFQGAIVNCDSVQLYRGLDIGAAKPSLAERQQAPHYMYDYVPEGETMTAGRYVRDFYEILERIPEQVVFVVGGTGFYFQAIEKGMYPVRQTPPDIQKQIADILQTEDGARTLYEEFRSLDPEAAAKIHSQDHYRLGRAMELVRAEGKSLTAIQKEFSQQQKPFPYPLLKIGLRWPKEILKERLLKRTQGMLKAGLLEEVRGLLDRGLGEWQALQSVGYKESLEFLREGRSEEWLVEEITKSSMGLAKRQRTWFQREKDIHWFEGADGFNAASEVVREFLHRTRP